MTRANWFAQVPLLYRPRQASRHSTRHPSRSIRPAASHLDPGERSAILVAQSEVEALVLIDEAAGRLEATRRGIPNTGTLGILRGGSIAQLLDLPSALARLLTTNFRTSQALVKELVDEDAARRRSVN
jgi:predicted nucleic acid-binding protein